MFCLPELFSPIKIGQLSVKNRLVMPAMSVNFGVDENGFVTNQLIEYFVTRAKAGTGMLIVGGGGIDPVGHELPGLPALWNQNCIFSLEKMTKKVKIFGAKIGMQLMHGGRQTCNDKKEAPSPIPAPAIVKGIPTELKIKRIRELVESFGNSAKYCKDAGFDFIEIHAAHGYLISQFLSPNANKRNDKYGGSFENRIRFLLEILENIKIKTLFEFPVGIRLNGEDYINDGWQLTDALKLSTILEKKGADYLHISAGVYGSSQLTIPSMYIKEGCFVPLASVIKNKVSIPVIAVGRIRDLEFANKQINRGKADMIAMGRSHLADPNLAKKGMNGNLSSIRPCIGCCLGCIDRILKLEAATCVVNPRVGREYQLKSVRKILKTKLLLVIGSGLSGLAAARKGALFGYSVVLLEKSAFIGGATKFASIPPGRSDLMDIINFFESELHRLHVEIRLNVNLSNTIINEIMPDKVIIATGGLTELPLIKGLSKTSINLYNPIEILKREVLISSQAVILGGNQIGLLVADYLSEKGKEITVLHRGKHFAKDMASNDRFYLRERLKKNKVQLYKKVKGIEILENAIVFRDNNYRKKNLKIKNLIISEKTISYRGVSNFFTKNIVKINIIGDAKKPGNIMSAINDGEQIINLI